MKILMATPYLPPRGGGLERYAGTLAATLAREGHDVTLVGHADDARDERGPEGVRRVGVPIAWRLSNTPLSPRFGRVLRALAAKDGAPDVIHAHTPVPGAAEMAWRAARALKAPFVVTYHAGALLSGSPLFSAPAALHRATVERAMLAQADGRVAVSPYVGDRVFRGASHALAPPGVDTRLFAPGGAPVPGRVLHVGPVSRAYAWKGLATLAEAMRDVRDHVPGAHLRVVGDGDLADRYRSQGVDVIGRVGDAQLADEYRAASVVVLPSLTSAESFGMVLAEANACGRPVVGSRVGGIPSFVRHWENGLLVEPGDARTLADAIARILLDRDLARRLGENGRAIVEREHTWARVAEAHLGEFERAISARRSARPSAARRAPAARAASGTRPSRP